MSKDPKPWNEDDELPTIELDGTTGGAAPGKSVPDQGGGDQGVAPNSDPQASDSNE